ncbi:glutamate dehydrogenase [Saccharopolyspora sp. NPDC050389]|uniref:Glu/Leu/Phe/Val family dehydrogenase n=1 Tax=Saccharopolyspora sp. NPDC050389 TaxID=3155516 RepID=UPI0033CFA452
MDPATSSAAVQGFGKVGRGAARLLAEAGVRVVAVSDQYGAVHHPRGLDIADLAKYVDRTGTVVGFAGADKTSNEDLLELDVDVLVPAAVESVITTRNAHRVSARIVVEGANGPTTPEADEVLLDKGVLVVPDILANAGGVIVSYFEWVQANQSYWWSEDEVRTRLANRMSAAWQNVREFAAERHVSLRKAATALAVERVALAHQLRGLYP